MSYRLEVRPQVCNDIAAAGLGVEFAWAVRDRIEAVQKQPLVARIRDPRRSVRWVFPRRFPYRIVYRVAGDVVLIIAVIHAAQHDPRWKGARRSPVALQDNFENEDEDDSGARFRLHDCEILGHRWICWEHVVDSITAPVGADWL
jgi:ParE-like toxin of type II ParDE toxin-antitoxin system